jgi:hypothetical protein
MEASSPRLGTHSNAASFARLDVHYTPGNRRDDATNRNGVRGRARVRLGLRGTVGRANRTNKAVIKQKRKENCRSEAPLFFGGEEPIEGLKGFESSGGLFRASKK